MKLKTFNNIKMELAKIMEKINEKIRQNLSEAVFADAGLYRYVFVGKRTFTINDVGLYEIMHEIMMDWLLNNIKKLKDVIPNFSDFLPDFEPENKVLCSDENITYNIEEIMKAYNPCPPLLISTVAKHLLNNSDVVIKFCEEVFTHWKCYNYKVFEEELKKNTKEALQRYLTASYIFAYNLPVVILLCAKEKKKTK